MSLLRKVLIAVLVPLTTALVKKAVDKVTAKKKQTA